MWVSRRPLAIWWMEFVRKVRYWTREDLPEEKRVLPFLEMRCNIFEAICFNRREEL